MPRPGAPSRPGHHRRGEDDRRGFVQKPWTFGGTVPGAVIRVKVGHTIRVHLKNPVENQLPHSIDFHASQVAWNDEMTSIKPGEEKLYEWTADVRIFVLNAGPSIDSSFHVAGTIFDTVTTEGVALQRGNNGNWGSQAMDLAPAQGG